MLVMTAIAEHFRWHRETVGKTEDVMYTSNSKLDGYGQDDRSIRHLQNELTVAASAKYQEKSNIKIIMTDPEGKESTVKEGMTSLKEAKAL